jgi:hypothetical protein
MKKVSRCFSLALVLLSIQQSFASSNFHYPPFLKSYKEKLQEGDKFADAAFADFHKNPDARQIAGTTVYTWEYPNEVEVDPDIGYPPNPRSQVRHIHRTENQIIFDVIYSFDEFRRRIVPVAKTPSYKKFAVFFGCSFTLGTAVNDDQTLPYFIAKNNNEYFPYNYGIGGQGTNTMLGLIQKTNFHEQIPEHNGVFVYVYMHDHLARATGKLPSLPYNKVTPFYELTSGGLERRGSFETGRPIYTRFLLFLNMLFGDNLLKNRYFPYETNADQDYVCHLISESKKLLSLQYPNSPFIVYAHPFTAPEYLKECGKKNSFPVFEGHAYAEKDLKKYGVPGNGHPNMLANELIAKELVEIIHKVVK